MSLEAQRDAPDALQDKKVDGAVRSSDRCDVTNQVLSRQVNDLVSNRVELRCELSSGTALRFDSSGRGSVLQWV